MRHALPVCILLLIPLAAAAQEIEEIVVTGTLARYSRDSIKQLIESHGGRASTSVSQKTDFLIAGDKAGSKRRKAEDLGITILSESEFERMLGE